MKNTISNGKITFVSDNFNVEPWVLRFSDDDVNYLWRPESLEKLGAAICFPLLGFVPENKYFLDGKEYIMEMHGFAKDSIFEIAERPENSISYEITNNEKTLAQYPFKFRFRVVYTVEDTSLKTEYRIKNSDDQEMYFSVGGHPGFACPIDGEGNRAGFGDYYLEFDKCEGINNIVKNYEPLSVIKKFFSADGGRLQLDYSMLAKGCICFHPINSGCITLKSEKSTRSLRLYVGNASHFQIWAAVGGDYICLEPWYGSITSLPSKSMESHWKERPGTLHIAPGAEMVCAYNVTLLK
jgi:galactose mutarotase-like enzyme